MAAELALRQLRRRHSHEQIESFDQKTKRHHRDRGAPPSVKGTLVGGVVAVALDHEINLGVAACLSGMTNSFTAKTCVRRL